MTPLEQKIKDLGDRISLSSGTTDPIDLMEIVHDCLKEVAYELAQMKNPSIDPSLTGPPLKSIGSIDGDKLVKYIQDMIKGCFMENKQNTEGVWWAALELLIEQGKFSYSQAKGK